MGCGYIDPSAGPIRIRSNVNRNLQSGDSIALIVGAPKGVIAKGVVSYAIAFK